jgi:hypothetical protein
MIAFAAAVRLLEIRNARSAEDSPSSARSVKTISSGVPVDRTR